MSRPGLAVVRPKQALFQEYIVIGFFQARVDVVVEGRYLITGQGHQLPYDLVEV